MTVIHRCLGVLLLTLAGLSQAAVTPTEEDLTRWGGNWDRLIPEGAYDFIPENFTFDLMFDPTFQAKLDEANLKLNPSLEGERLDLAGFMVPLETNGGQVSSFLLVPEAGQCVHVPPPPVNQTIFVDASQAPVALHDLYQPIQVIGRLSVGRAQHEIAESGYVLIPERVETIDLGDDHVPVVPGADGDR
ncbi:MAG: DUF3299 domain-containing protein [Gammaproteobacteria bacterium]|nr:DUF3299 domain-containing protein [Gammaproteobacteria bacterium]